MAERSPHLTVSPERGRPSLGDPERVRAALAVDPRGRGGRAGRRRGGAGSCGPARGRGDAGALPQRGGGDRCPKRRDSVDPPIRVAAPIAFRTGIAVGESVRLTSSRTRLSPIGPIPVSVTPPRRGPLAPQRAREGAARWRFPRRSRGLLAALPSGAQAFEARLSDPSAADRAARRRSRRASAAGYRVETWRERNAPALLRAPPREARHLRDRRARHPRGGVEHRLERRAARRREEAGPGSLHDHGRRAPVARARSICSSGAAIGGIGTAAGLVLGVAASPRARPLPARAAPRRRVPLLARALRGASAARSRSSSSSPSRTAIAAAVLPARAAARIAPGEAVEALAMRVRAASRPGAGGPS